MCARQVHVAVDACYVAFTSLLPPRMIDDAVISRRRLRCAATPCYAVYDERSCLMLPPSADTLIRQPPLPMPCLMLRHAMPQAGRW